MTLIKAMGLALLAATITALGVIGGFVFSVVSAVISAIVSVGGIFALVYIAIASSVPDKTKRNG